MPAPLVLTMPLAGVVAAAAGLAYGVIESRAFCLRRVTVPVLAPEAAPLRVLHISDLHLTPGQDRKRRWVSELAGLRPDLVVSTGDHWSSAEVADEVVDTYAALSAVAPAVFVPGNNDYYAPRPKNPIRYVTRTRGSGRLIPMDWDGLAEGLVDAGWTDLTQRRLPMFLAGMRVDLAGVDDAYLERDNYSQIAGGVADAVLAVGVTHTPEPRVLDEMAADGRRLLLAGHTHGGQVRIPGYGALVTNCGLDRAQARGLSRWGDGWLYVSAGIGTSPYTPIRFACRPEATLLSLVAGSRLPVG